KADWHTELRPAAEEALALLASPFHRHQHGAAPLSSDTDALAQPEDDQYHGRPEADARVSRHEADDEGRDSHQQQGPDQGGLPADAVAVSAEEPGADRPREKSGEEDRVRVQR